MNGGRQIDSGRSVHERGRNRRVLLLEEGTDHADCFVVISHLVAALAGVDDIAAIMPV